MDHSGEVLVLSSEEVLRRTVLAAPSLNLETRGTIASPEMDRLIRETEGVIVRGQKNPVRELIIYDSAGGQKIAEITLPSGRRLHVNLADTTEIAAGSSANIATALTSAFGIQDVAIVGAAGRGSGQGALTHSLASRGLADLLLFKRDGGTARSLVLYEANGIATILSKKPGYTVSAKMLETVRQHTAPSILICTGFLEFELPLVRALFTAPGVAEARILSPHVGCCATPSGREQCLELAAQANLFQANAFELGRLLDQGDDWQFPTDSQVAQNTLKQVGSRIVCITLGSAGSVTYDRESKQLLIQRAYDPNPINNVVGAGDVHLAALIWYLWLRRRRIALGAALEVAARICAAKITYANADLPRPVDGIPDSATRKPWVHEAETRHPLP